MLGEWPIHADGGVRYRARFNVGGAHVELREGTYTARVTTTERLAQSLAFTMRPAYARVTGGYRDRLEQGHLLVEVEVDAFEEGDYYVFGSLYTDDDIPMGSAETTQHLSAGTHWMALQFFGRLVHDAGRDGPFRLAHVSVAKRTFPLSQGVDADPDYWTQRYPLSALATEPYYHLDTTDGEP